MSRRNGWNALERFLQESGGKFPMCPQQSVPSVPTVPAAVAESGCPDVLGQPPAGRLLRMDVKGPAGKLHAAQATFLERSRRASGVGFVARDAATFCTS